MKTKYNKKFYQARIDSLKSANIIVPFILDLFNLESVIDVGCGTGEFLSVFKNFGVNKICGLDGDWVDKSLLRIPIVNFINSNFEKERISIPRKFDLVVSLEVAEHLSINVAKNFITDLTLLGDKILFSAAIPNQGGVCHINEQWPEYWINLFKENGFECYDCIRPRIWNDKNISVWYRQNSFLFIRKSKKEFTYLKSLETKITNLVHPDLYTLKQEGYLKIYIGKIKKWIKI